MKGSSGSQGRQDWLLEIGEMTGSLLGDGEGLEDWDVMGRSEDGSVKGRPREWNFGCKLSEELDKCNRLFQNSEQKTMS